MLLDLDALDANIDVVRRNVGKDIAVRVVAKSLPSLPLLRYVLSRLGTSRLMVFDDSLGVLERELAEADLSLGKPLPVQAARAYYAASTSTGTAPGARVTWLIDGPERLAQYAALARSLGVKMQIQMEIDVGLHRGGITEPPALRAMLQAISADPEHLLFRGLMGYDAHVASAPPLLSSRDRALSAVIRRYLAFREVVYNYYSDQRSERFVFNGAGSKTYCLYGERGPLNEVALGSALVMPSKFDGPTLAEHTSAVFIATPVLKRLQGTKIPFLEWASVPWGFWNPNRRITYFLFSGGWLAVPCSPAGLCDNPVYGFSTNQSILNGSEKTALSPDDWVFFRPTQSERVMQELGAIQTVRGGRLSELWSVLGPLP